jgi:8-oxo-dGTP diphosphatase
MDVVAAALVRGGRVLAARRSRPAAVAGGWEFPGGKVEPGESESAALARECQEELGIAVAIGDRLGEAVGARIRLVLYTAYVSSGEPVAGETHDALRWLGRDQLREVDWLPIDAELLPLVAELLINRAR